MAIAKRLQVRHEDVFAHGAFVVSDVSQVLDFDASTRENKVQARDKDNGLPLWQVEVLDVDPEANKKGRTVTVKFAAKVQPVPPEAHADLPLRPVEFDGLSALPYVDTNGNFSRIAWSFRAEGMRSPAGAGPAGVKSGPGDAGKAA
ncbi:MAG: plasmid replication, integration and excision activator [Ornithinimicrobium sp.]